MKSNFMTAEAVGIGHPDKFCDQLSDAILDEFIKLDPHAKAGIEALAKSNVIIIAGEISSNNHDDVNIEKIVKKVINDVGYPKHILNPDEISITQILTKQSSEINKAVVKKDGEIGAGDQGMMFGYASDETVNNMPLDLYIAKLLVNKTTEIIGLGPDAKSQVTLYQENNKKYIDSILVSTMHDKSISVESLRHILNDNIILILKEYDLDKYFTENTKIHINTGGSFLLGGPWADTGLTGRKIVENQFSGNAPIGGGCFSGKDPSKCDRSGSYAARYIAKNILNAGNFAEVRVQLAYMIGVAEPSSLKISVKNSHFDNIENVLDEKTLNKIKSIFPITPKQIIDKFDLYRPIYYQTAKYGHFGISSYPWEQLDKVDELKELFNL